MMRFLGLLTFFLLLVVCASAENERTVFVNPAAGRAYHATERCPSVTPLAAGGMKEMNVAAFAYSEYSSYRKCEVCFRELEDLGSPLEVGQIGSSGLYYPLWQPDDLKEPWTERLVGQYAADVNHDGREDTLELMLYPDGEGTAEQRISEGAMLLLRVRLGTPDGVYDAIPRFYSRGFTMARVGNGMLLAAHRNEKDYLVDFSAVERRGIVTMEFTVYWLHDGVGLSMTERQAIQFESGKGAEEVTGFRSALMAWTGNAALLLSAHVGREIRMPMGAENASPVSIITEIFDSVS